MFVDRFAPILGFRRDPMSNWDGLRLAERTHAERPKTDRATRGAYAQNQSFESKSARAPHVEVSLQILAKDIIVLTIRFRQCRGSRGGGVKKHLQALLHSDCGGSVPHLPWIAFVRPYFIVTQGFMWRQFSEYVVSGNRKWIYGGYTPHFPWGFWSRRPSAGFASPDRLHSAGLRSQHGGGEGAWGGGAGRVFSETAWSSRLPGASYSKFRSRGFEHHRNARSQSTLMDIHTVDGPYPALP